MAEILKQTLEQKLQQRLAPLQVQFVRMLEMNGPEVEEEVRREVDDNPALEEVDPDPAGARYDDIPGYRLRVSNSSPDDPSYEPVIAASGETLQEMLMRQLTEQGLDARRLRIAEYIIGNIDNNGYLTRDLNLIINDLAVTAAIDTDRNEMRVVADAIRRCDPAGVGAIDLRDCLLLQLRRMPDSDKATVRATEIVADYFDLFSKKHYDRLRAAMGLTPDELRDAIGVITSLNPKPGSAVGSGSGVDADTVQAITPDFTVDVDADQVSVALANSIPELRIEQSFRIDADTSAPVSRQSREAEAFIRRKSEDAATFIKVLKMRQETLFRIMSAIVRLQRDFFTGGDDESLIRPMILKDVAAATGYDISVISRATAGKWVATAHGVYPLKMFFNERVSDDSDTSSHEVLSVIRDIISGEDKRHPLSDEAITARLAEQGYDIARRTVAKYRERLGLPVARLRREM